MYVNLPAAALPVAWGRMDFFGTSAPGRCAGPACHERVTDTWALPGCSRAETTEVFQAKRERLLIEGAALVGHRAA